MGDAVVAPVELTVTPDVPDTVTVPVLSLAICTCEPVGKATLALVGIVTVKLDVLDTVTNLFLSVKARVYAAV